MSVIYQQDTPQSKEVAVNMAQAAGTYTLLTATGDVLVTANRLYQITIGAVFTSAAIQTNDTTPFAVMTATEGLLTNLTAGKNITTANINAPFLLRSGQTIQLTMAGTTGTGTATLGVVYMPLTAGATLS